MVIHKSMMMVLTTNTTDSTQDITQIFLTYTNGRLGREECTCCNLPAGTQTSH
uniref:Uncharacterized protein n=1 Tax=Arion vulgaris TaxID=1028688 RepID=A0A0B7ANN9_9EUPU